MMNRNRYQNGYFFIWGNMGELHYIIDNKSGL